MNTCLAYSNGYRFSFQDGVEKHIIVIDNLESDAAVKFLTDVKRMETLDDVDKGIVLSGDYRIVINGYDFPGIGSLTIMPSDDPGEVLVVGSYKSIIQLGPSTYGGSGNVFHPVIKVKVDDILNCHPNLVLP